MIQFAATVKSSDGETKSLVREAESRGSLLAALRGEGLTPVRVEEVALDSAASGGVGLDWRALFRRGGERQKPRRKDMQAFMSNFATLLRSGMDLERCLKTLEKESGEPLRSVLAEMSQGIRRGESLSEAMARTGAFSEFHVRVVRAGEFGGNLYGALSRIAVTIEREGEVRGKIRNAVAYPAFLILFGFASFIVMLLFVLPKFTSIYDEMGADLPFMTTVMIELSRIARTHAIWMLPLLAISVFFTVRYLSRYRENMAIDRARMKIPVLGPLIRNVEAAGFLRGLGLLLQSGMPATQALHLVSKVSDSAVFARAALRVEEGVQKGGKISVEMRKQGLFSETILNLVAVGEESGRLEELLLEVSEDMEKKMDQMVKGAITLLEPVLILAVGAVIGLMVMATLLPIFSISAGLRK